MFDLTYYDFGAKGTRGPTIKDSGGVSKAEDNWIVLASPTSSRDELAIPTTLILPIQILSFVT